jgi:hypothetical protein
MKWMDGLCLTAKANGGKCGRIMATEKSKLALIIVLGGLFVVLFLGGIGFFAHKLMVQSAQRKEMEELKKENPVEYYIQHTPAKNAEDVRASMLGTWRMAALRNRQTGDFIFLGPNSLNFKSWTQTNWSIITYDMFSNVQYTASGHYTLEGDTYTESIEEATGQMTRYLGAHPKFTIRVDGDNYYQMSADKKNTNPLEEMWQRAGP